MKKSATKKNYKNIIKPIIVGLEMTIVFVISMILLQEKLKGKDYVFIGLSFNKILIGEIAQFVIMMLIYLSLVLIPKKKITYYKLINLLCGLSLVINFVLIAFMFYSYAGFINTINIFLYAYFDKKKHLSE